MPTLRHTSWKMLAFMSCPRSQRKPVTVQEQDILLIPIPGALATRSSFLPKQAIEIFLPFTSPSSSLFFIWLLPGKVVCGLEVPDSEYKQDLNETRLSHCCFIFPSDSHMCMKGTAWIFSPMPTLNSFISINILVIVSCTSLKYDVFYKQSSKP